MMFSVKTTTLNCVFIIIAALGLNTLFAVIFMVSKVVKWVRSRRLGKNDARITHFEEGVHNKSEVSFENLKIK